MVGLQGWGKGRTGLAWLDWAGKEVAQHACAGFWCFESENLNSFFPSLCRGAVVVSFTAGCGERERRGSAKTPFGGRVKGCCCSTRSSESWADVVISQNFLLTEVGEMRLSSRIYSAIRASVNSSEIRYASSLSSLLEVSSLLEWEGAIGLLMVDWFVIRFGNS